MGSFFGPKMPCLCPDNGEEISSPFLRFFFRSSIFATARFVGGFWATSSVFCCGRVFVGSECAFLYGLTYVSPGVLSSPFSGFWGCCFRVRFFFSPLPPSSSPFLLLGSARSLFPFFSACAPSTATPGGGKSVLRKLSLAFCLFLSFLSPRAGSPLSLAPVSLSLSLLSLSLLHALH